MSDYYFKLIYNRDKNMTTFNRATPTNSIKMIISFNHFDNQELPRSDFEDLSRNILLVSEMRVVKILKASDTWINENPELKATSEGDIKDIEDGGTEAYITRQAFESAPDGTEWDLSKLASYHPLGPGYMVYVTRINIRDYTSRLSFDHEIKKLEYWLHAERDAIFNDDDYVGVRNTLNIRYGGLNYSITFISDAALAAYFRPPGDTGITGKMAVVGILNERTDLRFLANKIVLGSLKERHKLASDDVLVNGVKLIKGEGCIEHSKLSISYEEFIRLPNHTVLNEVFDHWGDALEVRWKVHT